MTVVVTRDDRAIADNVIGIKVILSDGIGNGGCGDEGLMMSCVSAG